MASVCICFYCDREVKPKQISIECITCCSWVHKGCTGLTKSEYEKICADFRKTKSHNWECKVCKETVVKRLSLNSASNSRKNSVSKESADNGKQVPNADFSSLLCNTVDAVESETAIKDEINNLLKKSTTTNKDVLVVIVHIINLLLNQRTEVQATIDTIKASVKSNEAKVETLEKKLEGLQEKIETMCGNGSEEIRNQSVSIIKDEQDMFLELEDRSSRSKNILIYNVDESQSKVTNERIDHDKANIREVLTKLEVGATEFKVLRVGRGNSSSDRPRPLKVIFQNNTTHID
ncbi:uncharacterized protein LOC126890032 [Diabrotica virgifera virgifera]|uniref:PHD-type domain-containing protein n=1 Tax=Diabrotica virgifera virgifera TaxID=50390 RepID=A0ABM5K252_DIAVI|nr:uncharacterized protein LOC126883080 [Diabrotica virgifera virgifera]XP_050514808.1 uncharacterized protein LOC126890032 [Diabrotica virgifera virgifera]